RTSGPCGTPDRSPTGGGDRLGVRHAGALAAGPTPRPAETRPARGGVRGLRGCSAPLVRIARTVRRARRIRACAHACAQVRHSSVIRFQTLGTLDVTLDGAQAPPQLLWKKNVALLLYLARAPKRRCTREQLIGLLWPDKEDAAARQSVREAIRMVRHYVGEDRLKTAGDVIQLENGVVELDTDEFERLVQQRDWAATLPLINGKFLDGFKISDAGGFEDWLTIERSHWNGRSLDALLNLAEACLAAGDELGADTPLRKARDIDPQSQR